MPKYDVRLTGLAYVEASMDVEADSVEEAERIARERTGDVLWSYEGVKDSTIKVEVEEDD